MNECLMKRIERLRAELSVLVHQRGLQDCLVIKKSQQLDKLIVNYMNRTPQRKPSEPHTKSADGIKISYYHSKFQRSLRKKTDDLFARMEGLHREIDELAKQNDLFHTDVMEKSRQLDKLLMSYIQSIRL